MYFEFFISEKNGVSTIALLAISEELSFYSRIENGKAKFTKKFDLNAGLHVTETKPIEPSDILCIVGLKEGLIDLYNTTEHSELKEALKENYGDLIEG